MPNDHEISQKHFDHFWHQFDQGRRSGDHSEQKVFAETLQSFARWYAERMTAQDTSHA